MKRFLLFCAVLFCSVIQVEAQVTIVSQGFESGDTWTITSTTGNESTNAGASDFPANQRIKSGMSSFQTIDFASTLELDEIDISGYVNVTTKLYISSTALTSGNGADGADNVKVFVALDGAAFSSTPDIEINGNSNARWGYDATLVASTVAGTPMSFSPPQSGTSTNNYSEIVISIPNSATSVKLKVEAQNNNTSEVWNLDDIILEGVDPTVAVIDFDATSSTEVETNAPFNVDIPVTLSNFQGTQVDLSVTATLGTAEASDFVLNTTTLSFTADGTQNVSVTINDDAGYDDETFTLTIAETSATGAIISQDMHEVTIDDDEIAPAPTIRINELDPNTPGADDMSFIELFGDANLSLDDFVLVLYNGSNNESYDAIDLTGESLNAEGYFVVGNALVANVDKVISGNFMQNGVDGIGLYQDAASNFPDGTIVTTTNLLDGVVYGSSMPSATMMLLDVPGLGPVDENVNGNADTESIQRGSWVVNPPTPGEANNTTLPVSLHDFSGYLSNETVNLEWSVTSEIDNDYFEIFRLENEEFRRIGKVDGAGYSDTETFYNFLDRNPLSGVNIYRLAQRDYGGQYKVLGTVSVKNVHAEVQVYPSLVSDYLTVETQEPVSLKVFNIAGQLINSYSIENTQNVNMSELQSGAYIIQIAQGSTVNNKRIIKQ